MLSHAQKVALVTGGNRGIGYELVKQLALNGFKVILSSRDPKKRARSYSKTEGIQFGRYVRRD